MTQILRRLILAFALMAGIAPAVAQVPPAVPALPDTERRTTYSISASTCACAIGFQLYGDSTDYANWVEVWINGSRITQSGNWTITSPTGSLATIPRPITDAVLTFTSAQTGTVQIVGARRPRRTSQFSENRGVAARDLNQALSDIVAQNRETWDKINDVTGRAVLAPPGETISVLLAAANRKNLGACFDNSGNLVACTSVPSSTFAAGSGITFTGTNPTTISAATYSAGVGIQFTGTNPTVIAVSQTTGVPVIPSRAQAITQDLSAYTVVSTLGYTTGGDGGGASFQKKPAGTAFLDTYINNSSSPPTLVGGSSYTNGTYLGVQLGGGVGLGCSAQVTVSGGAVTVVSLAVPCAGYKVGDVLTATNTFIGGTGSGFTWTVTAISTPQASFTDSAGNLWQYSPGGIPNALQFGCKGDWNGTDGTATNNAACVWSAASWASFPIATSVAQVNGNRVYFPRGAYMTCGTWNGTIYGVPVPQGVVFTGAGIGGSTLMECTADNSGTQYIELCDSNAAVGQYGCKVENMTINTAQIVTSTAGAAAIYSNSGQQFPLADTVEIQPGLKGCIKYETGKGGAANDTWLNIDCEQKQAASNPALSFNASSTQHILRNSTIGCSGTGCTTAISHLNGRLIVDGLDVENFATGLFQSVSTAGNISVYRNVQQNSNNCSQAITLNSGNTGGNLVLENIATSCPKTITNGQTAGTDYTGNIRGPTMCVSGACAAAVP